MCGIAGIAYSKKSGRKVDVSLLARMRDILYHRGPDDADGFTTENIGLAHRRLSIVDLAMGRQPMTNEDGSLQIVYNGEVYNHADYRDELLAKGHIYKTHCDTETILHLYEEHGADCVQHLRGMFAFAIWDANKKDLFIARDRLGVKPLYYVFNEEGSLFFASEIKALLEAGAVEPELNYAVLPEQFANHGTNSEETLLRGVKRLLPGHFLRWHDGEIEIKKYWDVSYLPKLEVKNERDIIEEWRELFNESVRLRLMADVPLGMFLSGGIDSSAIAATMATMVDEPIKTFSVAFTEREANELEYARLIAEKFATDHHEIVVTPKEFFDALPKLVWHEDEPLPFSSCVPLYFVSKLAENHVKVVLTGEGSDEILGGYGRYHKTVLNLSYGRRYEALTPKVIREIVRGSLKYFPVKYRSKLTRTFLNLPVNIESLYHDNFAIFRRHTLSQLFSQSAKEQIGELKPFAISQNYIEESDAQNLLDKLLFADTKTYLHDLLMKQDRMSMAASIESRVPFLDYKLVEFTSRLPEKFKLRGRQTKWILREAMRGFIPDEIITRPKMGFPVPLGDWLRGEFAHIVEEYVLSERTMSRGIFDADFIRNLVARHNAGENHAPELWSLINFEIWARQFIDRKVF
jgi:asparagine synthase (glutamine-hydrolysing)